MMKRDECFRVLARHIKDEAVVATYSSAVDWVGVAPRVLNYTSIGAMGLDSSHGLGPGARAGPTDASSSCKATARF